MISANADYLLRLRMFQREQSRYSPRLCNSGPAFGLRATLRRIFRGL